MDHFRPLLTSTPSGKKAAVHLLTFVRCVRQAVTVFSGAKICSGTKQKGSGSCLTSSRSEDAELNLVYLQPLPMKPRESWELKPAVTSVIDQRSHLRLNKRALPLSFAFAKEKMLILHMTLLFSFMSVCSSSPIWAQRSRGLCMCLSQSLYWITRGRHF